MTDFAAMSGGVVVSKLVLRATECADRQDWRGADALYHEAISMDSTACSRIAYGVCLAEQERYFEAITVFTPVLDGQDRSAIAIVSHNLAAIYREVGDLDLARRFQWRATVLQDDLGSHEMLGMASDALMTERHDMAEVLIQTASQMDDQPVDGLDADLTATLALIQATSESLEEGVLLLFQAYGRHRQAGNLRAMGIDLLNLSVIFGELNRPSAERKCLVRAIRCFRQASAPLSCQRAVQQLAMLDRIRDAQSFDVRRN